jgi:hypothetical protein
MYVLVGWIREEFVEVRIYFGTQSPSDAVLSEAQAQLATLDIPEAVDFVPARNGSKVA